MATRWSRWWCRRCSSPTIRGRSFASWSTGSTCAFPCSAGCCARSTRSRSTKPARWRLFESYRLRHRGDSPLAAAVAVREMVERGYSHLLTDVYEGEPHSPLDFHTRVLGFRRVGTHRFGDLNCSHLRIILVLDVQDAYRRLKQKNNKVFREVGDALRDLFEPAHDAAALTA